MEGLTKQQLILLALLVSFVTSMATGIVTVSLMDQAPKSVTQTINRVVERTVERVVASGEGSGNVASVISKETVVVRDDEAVVSAVEKNKKSIARIIKIRNEFGEPKEEFGGLATVVSEKSILVADIGVLQKKYDAFGTIVPESYKAVNYSGQSFAVVPVGTDEANNLVFFEARAEDGKPDYTAFKGASVSLGDSDKLKLGQAVVSIGGESEVMVSTGIVSSFIEVKDKTSSLNGLYSSIKTDIQYDGAVSGTILVNFSGEVVGILNDERTKGGAYVPSKIVLVGVKSLEARAMSGSSL